VALWRVAREAVTVGIAKGEEAVAVFVLRSVQRPSHHGPCPGEAEQAAEGLGHCGMVVAPMRLVPQGGGLPDWSKHCTSAVQYFSLKA
jgi:hypothetical protein